MEKLFILNENELENVVGGDGETNGETNGEISNMTAKDLQNGFCKTFIETNKNILKFHGKDAIGKFAKGSKAAKAGVIAADSSILALGVGSIAAATYGVYRGVRKVLGK